MTAGRIQSARDQIELGCVQLGGRGSKMGEGETRFSSKRGQRHKRCRYTKWLSYLGKILQEKGSSAPGLKTYGGRWVGGKFCQPHLGARQRL